MKYFQQPNKVDSFDGGDSVRQLTNILQTMVFQTPTHGIDYFIVSILATKESISVSILWL